MGRCRLGRKPRARQIAPREMLFGGSREAESELADALLAVTVLVVGAANVLRAAARLGALATRRAGLATLPLRFGVYGVGLWFGLLLRAFGHARSRSKAHAFACRHCPAPAKNEAKVPRFGVRYFAGAMHGSA